MPTTEDHPMPTPWTEATPTTLAALRERWATHKGDIEAETIIRHGRDGYTQVGSSVGADVRDLLDRRPEGVVRFRENLYMGGCGSVTFEMAPEAFTGPAGCFKSAKASEASRARGSAFGRPSALPATTTGGIVAESASGMPSAATSDDNGMKGVSRG